MERATMNSPVGALRLSADEEGLRAIEFGGAASRAVGGVLGEAMRQLHEYFEGERERFDLPLAPRGTDFQQAVWRELAAIPFGATVTYGELARRVGRPRASRAVGAANGRNPLPIVLPCHRVIGKNGHLTGFGGGLEKKRWLLAHEARGIACRAQH